MQIIYLSNDDTVDAIANKIKASQEKEINMVVLSRSIPVLSVMNLKMFKKIAESLNKIISVSTADEGVKILVENSGIPIKSPEDKKSEADSGSLLKHNINNTFAKKPRLVDTISLNKGPLDLSCHKEPAEDIGSKMEPDPRIGARPIFSKEKLLSHSDINTENNDIIETDRAPKKEKDPVKFHVPRSSRNIFIGFIFLVIIAVGIAAYVLLPTAKIVITPKANPVNSTFDFIIGTNIKSLDINNKKVPAVYMTTPIEKEGQFTATGKKQVVSSAEGTVTFYNEWSSMPQKIVDSTRLSTADGKIFKTAESVVIPGFIRDENGSDVPGKIDVRIIAADPGPEYNIAPSDFSIVAFKGMAKYVKIYAKSQLPTAGGASGFTTVVSPDDLKKAKEYLADEAKKNVFLQLNEKKPSDMTLIEQTISIKDSDISSSIGVDQTATKFKASLKTSAVAFLFNSNDVKAIAKSDFEKQSEDQKDFVLVDSGIDYGDATIIGADSLKITAQSHANKYNLISEDDMRSRILGMSKEELEKYIKDSYPNISKINVTLWPFWVTKIPTIKDKVTVTLDIVQAE